MRIAIVHNGKMTERAKQLKEAAEQAGHEVKLLPARNKIQGSKSTQYFVDEASYERPRKA